MTTEEANGILKITVSPEEYRQLAAAELPGHTKQEAGAALKREIETIMMTRIRTYGTCNATLTVDWHTIKSRRPQTKYENPPRPKVYRSLHPYKTGGCWGSSVSPCSALAAFDRKR